MKFRLSLLAAAGTLALAGAATAQEAGDYYGAIGAGVALGSDSNSIRSEGANPADFIGDIETNDAIAIYGALGRYLDGGLRIELELANRSQDVDEIPGDGLGFGGFPTTESELGEIQATSLVANIIKDFNVDSAGRLTPYIGLGAGLVNIRSEYNNVSSVGAAGDVDDAFANGNRIVVSDTEYAFAGQALAGLSFDFTDNMMIDIRYKYLRSGEYEIGGFFNNEFAGLDGEYDVHEVTGGLRWNFGGGAAAPAPVAAAPTPVVEYKTCFDGSRVQVTQACPIEDEVEVEIPEELELTVYFDYDSAALTDASRAIIQARAAEAREYNISTITVQGNTDSSGSSAYNERLSARRAGVVRDALVANGITSNVISIEALGETNPAKPTADGVREPLNRRTEVEFNFNELGL